MPSVNATPFVDQVLQSELLDAAQRAEFVRLHATISDSRELARELLRRDWLTAYQVNQLLQGRGDDLTIGPFVLLERVGEGGMGQVFKAKQKMLNRVVALKVIRKECINNPRVILRFQREIRAAGKLSHPHIVRAYDADQVNGTYYIAMEYIDGVDLARLVKDSGPLRVDQACEYIRQAALGLQHASERGVIHRDIKPANLLVARGIASDRRRSSACIRRPDLHDRKSNVLPKPDAAQHYPWGVVKILDMGLARYTEAFNGRASTHLTQIGSIMGTPEYIAPEQARDSHTSDVRADLYSLGCTLYFLLTGQPPFPEGTLTEKLMKHQTEDPVAVGIVRRQRILARQGANEPASVDKAFLHVPRRVDDVLRKLLAKRPEDRYQTPNDLANELQTILRKLADGTLLTEEDAEPTSAVAYDLPALSESLPSTTVMLANSAEKRKAQSSTRWAGKIAFACAALGSVAVILVASAIAVVMARSNSMHASDVPHDHSPKQKDREEQAWKRSLRQAIAHNGGWDDARQEIRRARGAATSPEQAKMLDVLLAMLPTPFDLLDRSRFDGAMPPGLPTDVVGVYGFAKGNAGKPVLSLAVSPNGRWIATNEDNGVRIFDLQSSLIPHKIWAHSERVTRVAIAPDGRVLASAGDDGLVRLWDLATRAKSFSLDKHKRPVTQLAFNHDGSLLASAGRDGVIRLWDPRTGGELRAFDKQPADVGALAFAADGKTLFWSSGPNLFWSDARVAMPSKLDTKQPGLRLLACQPHGNLVVAGNGQGLLTVFIWDGVELKEKVRLTEQQQTHAIAFAVDGKSFVSAGNDPSATLWSADTLKSIKSWKNPRGVMHTAAFSPENRHLVLGAANGQVHVMRLAAWDGEGVKKAID